MTRLASIILLIGLWSSPAMAKIMVVEIGVDVQREVKLHPGLSVTITSAEPITMTILGNEVDYWSRKIDNRHYVLDIKTKDAPLSNYTVFTWSGNVIMRISATSSTDEAVDHIRLVYPPTTGESNPEKALTPQQAKSLEHRAIAKYAMQTTAILPGDFARWRKGVHALELRTGYIGQGTDTSVFPFTVANTGDYAYPIMGIELRDHLGNTLSTSVHTKEEILGADSELPSGVELVGAFVLESPVRLDKGWTLRLITTESMPKAQFKSRPRREFVPGMLELRTMFVVHGMGGAGKLSDNLGQGRSAWGTVTAVGFRVGYGPGKHTALEGGLDFVRIASTRIEMAQDGLETSANGGRLYLGGRLHAGSKVVSYARAGLGVMFASHSFNMGGVRDSEIRGAILGSVGAGVEAWFGERVIVGLGVATSAPLGGDDTGFVVEGGLRIGLAFGKLRDHWVIR